MVFTETDLAEQQRVFAEIKEEFSRLNVQFDAMLKQGGLTSEALQKALNEKHPPEVQTYLDNARADAVRAGQARATQAKPVTGRAPSTAGRGRPGVVRL